MKTRSAFKYFITLVGMGMLVASAFSYKSTNDFLKDAI